ncbi:MAG: NUDIX domain-containing protein [Clostridiaceae bacterium]|nr:NUDIX domain-containing protein [Clostridiaceae bacterium]
MKFEKSCGAVIYKENKGEVQYLIISHQGDGHWCFPKGHQEKKETEEETAIREIKEETGLKVKLVSDFRTQIEYFPKKNISKEVIFFLAKVKEEVVTIQLEEISDFKWLGYDEALNRITYERSREVLEKVNSYLKAIKE